MDILNDIEIDDELKSKLTEKLGAIESEYKKKIDALTATNAGLLDDKEKWRRQRDEAQQKAEEERILAQRQAEEKAKAENDYKQLFESQKQESENLKSQLQQFQENIKEQKVQREASRLASALTKDISKAKILEQQFRHSLQLVDGELRVMDDRGNLTVQTLDELSSSIKEKYPFLVDGVQATGGGATRTSGRTEVGLKEITREDFNSLSQVDRAKFFKDGGKLVNQ